MRVRCNKSSSRNNFEDDQTFFLELKLKATFISL